jgi:hypothetical protein
VDKTITEKAITRDKRFYPVVRPSNTCLLPRCGFLMDEGCTQPLSSDPMINFLPYSFFPVCEESPQVGASHPQQQRSQRRHKSKARRATHTTHKSTAHTCTQAKT